MRAAAIFFFARVIRAAMVGSLTRKARATSAVVSPQSSRRVSATCASGASAGWQQVKISRSRSSGNAVVLGGRRRGLVLDQQRQRPAQRRLAPEQVERPAPGHRGQPGAGPGRDARSAQAVSACA